MSKVTVHIEELVLRGVSPVDQAQIGAAVEQALAQLIAERGLPVSWQNTVHLSHVDGGRIARPGTAESLGRHVAQAVYGKGGR